ncbi:hypothetical protein VPH35_094158 [Triticum aestivum]
MEEAMASLAKATRSFLVKPQREFTISSLRLKLYFINTFLFKVGLLVGDTINSGSLKDLDLAILDEKDYLECTHPSVLSCLTKLSLQNVDFDKLDMHHIIFDCCKQLKHLSLTECDIGGDAYLFKIDAPNSKLCILELTKCGFVKLEVVCLLKLEKFNLNSLLFSYVPLAFGFVLSLEELELISTRGCYEELKLSELLYGTTCIHTLTLDFEGENMNYISFLRSGHIFLWMQPEMKQLCPAFNKLRKLFVRGIFVEFDILWTMAFLAAAPSIEMLHIEVWDHVCDVGEVEDDYRRQNNTERRTPQWEVDFNDTKNWILKELEFIGFRSLEQQFTFIRSVLQRSPNLHKIVLKRDDECDLCAAHGALPSKFPKKDEQEMIMRRIRDGIFSPQIVFDEYSERRRRM